MRVTKTLSIWGPSRLEARQCNLRLQKWEDPETVTLSNMGTLYFVILSLARVFTLYFDSLANKWLQLLYVSEANYSSIILMHTLNYFYGKSTSVLFLAQKNLTLYEEIQHAKLINTCDKLYKYISLLSFLF